MAQHDYVIDNSTGANVRADINSALLAISSNNSGSSAPSTTYALQSFANTTDSILQLRNAANNAFVNLRKFDGSLPLPDGSESSPSLFFDDDTNTGIYSSATDTLNITTGGSTAVTVNSSQNVGIGTTSPTGGKLHIVHGNELGIFTSGPFNFQAKFESTDAEAAIVIEDSNSTNDGNRIGVITNDMTFVTNDSERFRIDSSGNCTVNTGNLVIGTSGKGVDFSATSGGAGTDTSELLADYEEGTFVPTLPNGGGSVSFTIDCAKYIKIGNVVNIFLDLRNIANHAVADMLIGNFPYTASSNNATTAIPRTSRADPSNGVCVGVFDSSNFASVRSQFSSIGLKGDIFNGENLILNLSYITN